MTTEAQTHYPQALAMDLQNQLSIAMQDFLSYLEEELPKIHSYLFDQTSALDPVVRSVANYVLEAGGKRMRPLLTLLTARALGHPPDQGYAMACSMEFLHSASLLHDDILDSSLLRRNLPTAHTIFGLAPTVLAGDVLLALGNKIIASHGDPRISILASEALMETASGESLEISQAFNFNLDMDGYLKIVTGKTAFLIQAACGCGALLAKAEDHLVEAALTYGLNLGVAFQLVDDALDYDSTEANAGKPVGGDLREGKITLPLILYLQDQPKTARQELADQCRASKDDSALQELVESVRRGGYSQKTRAFAETYVAEARRMLQKFPPSRERGLLQRAMEFILIRDR